MIRKILINLLALIFSLFPRNPNLWVTGKIVSWEGDNLPPAFFDNSKYFYLYLINSTRDKVYWLSSSDEEIELLQSLNLPVVRFPSIKGIFLVLRAKYFFHHYGPDQIDFRLQRGSIQLDFWHGTPLKKIRYDVVPKPIEQRNRIRDFLNKGSAEYVSSTSNYLSDKILAHAFNVSKDKMINFGYPRNDILKLNRAEAYAFCSKYTQELLPYLEMVKRYQRVFLYMPTWRDDDPDYFSNANIDFSLLSKNLTKINAAFFLKLHPLTKFVGVGNYTNIFQINNDVDIYPFLIYTDYLITDYSSIYFDYLLLDREIIFIPYDYENYISNRELYFDYDEITPGIKYYSFSDFINNLDNVEKLDYKNQRNQVKNLLIQDYNFDACERTYHFFKEMEK